MKKHFAQFFFLILISTAITYIRKLINIIPPKQKLPHNHQSLTTDYRSLITDYRSLITNYRLPITNYRAKLKIPLTYFLTLKVDSYSLIYAVFIVLTIAAICGAFILASYNSSLLLNRYIGLSGTKRNINSAFQLFLAQPTIVPQGQTKSITIGEFESDTVTLTRSHWGAYDLLICSSTWKKERIVRMALAGTNTHRTDTTALYIQDIGKPLSVCGSTEIQGTCFLPEAGIKRAYIEGKNFIGFRLIEGKVQNSEKILPQPSDNFVNDLSSLIKCFNTLPASSEMILWEKIEKDTIERSFSTTTLYIISHERLRLSGKILKGNIIVISPIGISVANDAILEDVILLAPGIRVEKKTEGRMQLFASDSIAIEEEAVLHYPSATVIVNPPERKDTSTYIRIMNKASVFGCVAAYKKKYSPLTTPAISIMPEARIFGQIYCNGIVQHKGELYGSIYCQRFMLSTPSSVYENHLLDAVINFPKLSRNYSGVDIFGNAKQYKLIKWLN